MSTVTQPPAIIRVSTKSRASAVAGAIAGIMRQQGCVDVQAIGAEAVNQAVKSLAIARTYLINDGITLMCVPHFVNVEINGEQRTAVRFSVESRL